MGSVKLFGVTLYANNADAPPRIGGGDDHSVHDSSAPVAECSVHSMQDSSDTPTPVLETSDHSMHDSTAPVVKISVHSMPDSANPAGEIVTEICESSVERKRKREEGESSGIKKRKEYKKRDIDLDAILVPSFDEHPIQRMIAGDESYTKAEFLYRKYIEDSDVNPNFNRLLLAKSDRLMDFFTEEERNDVATGKGIKVSGFDSNGSEYLIDITRWNSQKRPVIYKDSWRELIRSNHVEEGDIVEIWGCRRQQRLVLVINFRKPNQFRLTDAANSS